MNNSSGKQLSNPFSTGGGGGHFEAHVQASFVALMLTGGYAPCLPCTAINKIKLQGKFTGYQTDDLIVFVKDLSGKSECKLLGQIKHTISITESDSTFSEVIQAAWQDFNNSSLFNKGKDVIALITGPLSATDTSDVRTILEWARHSENSAEFFRQVELANFSSDAKRTKLKAFKAKLKVANANTEVPEDKVYEFLRHFHLLGYDLDIRAGVTLALLHSLIGQYSTDSVQSIWARIVDVVQSTNQNAGTITMSSIPEDLLTSFQRRSVASIPSEFVVPSTPVHPSVSGSQQQLAALTLAALIGSWDERNESDMEVIRRLANGF